MTKQRNQFREVRADNGSTDISTAKIGLISAIVVAFISLIGTLINAYFSSQAVQAPVLIPIQATQTAEARTIITTFSLTPTAMLTAPLKPNSSPVAQCPKPKVYNSSENFDNEMMPILGTKFLMGDEDIEPPKHEVEVKSFLIDKFEVTNLQYKRFVEDTNHQPPDLWKGMNFPLGRAFHPVVNVTWNDAVAYCKWVGKRLPTEAEWELACRGKGDQLYPWGDEYNPHLANSSGSSCAETLSVGSYSPDGDTSYQISDMLGNVNEWTSSISMDYPYQFNDGREEVSNPNEYRAIRGGSFELELLSCVKRLGALPFSLKEDIGFRCAKDLTISP